MLAEGRATAAARDHWVRQILQLQPAPARGLPPGLLAVRGSPTPTDCRVGVTHSDSSGSGLALSLIVNAQPTLTDEGPNSMATTLISPQVLGKTIRLSWTDGPTKGTTQEHVFHEDGTVEWHSVENEAKAPGAPAGTPHVAARQAERPPFAAEKVTDDVCMISYLSQSGYTLTCVLDLANRSVVGVASNEKTWVPVRGRLEVV